MDIELQMYLNSQSTSILAYDILACKLLLKVLAKPNM